MSETLRTALREACAELREHMTPDWQAYTSLKQIEEWERLADEPDAIPDTCAACGHARAFHQIGTGNGVPVGKEFCDDRHGARCGCAGYVTLDQPIGDRDIKPENIAPDPARRWCVECDAVVPGGGCCECCTGADGGGGGTCPNHPPLPVDRDVKPANVTRTAADIRAEIYGMPPYKGPKVRHGPGGTGRPGPCDAGCRKCALGEAEIAALEKAEVKEQCEPAEGAAAISGLMPKWEYGETEDEWIEHVNQWMVRQRIEQTTAVSGSPPHQEIPRRRYPESREAWLARVDVAVKWNKSAEQALEQAWADVRALHDPPLSAAAPPPGFDRLQASLVAPVSLRLFSDEPPSDGIPALEQLQRIVRAQYRPPALPPPGHATLCCARLGSVWCTEPSGHAGACKGPEDREIAGNDFGPRGKR